jgi:glucokinase
VFAVQSEIAGGGERLYRAGQCLALFDAAHRTRSAAVAREGATIGLVGADAGLGVSGLVPAGDRWIAIDSEGGHSHFRADE